ncbi:MAG: hypothetical protein JRJ09_18480, partial [Deltaproteobacteria bacterium]|nr:hypothetical protein [Deltaproteobacteria bacterium]MBW2050492.1 hypothetical protein [Deltaproteobacteria bacterium]
CNLKRRFPWRCPIEPVLLLLTGAGLYVGWNIGANDTANCIGTTLGCGLISFTPPESSGDGRSRMWHLFGVQITKGSS